LNNEDTNFNIFDSVFDSGNCSKPQLGHRIILQLWVGHPWQALDFWVSSNTKPQILHLN